MKMKGLILVLIFSLAINAAILATAGYHYYRSMRLGPSAPYPPSSGDHHIYQTLGLSDLQLAKMRPLARAFHARLEELGAAMEGKRKVLVDLLSQEKVDPDRIEGLRGEMAGIQGEIQKEVIAHILESKKILNPEQQQRFFGLLRQSMARGKSPWLPRNRGE